jgi:hypothetical protein
LIAAPVFGARRWVVTGIAGAVAIGAGFGGWGLLSDAETLGAKSEWLDGSPFPNYRIPGVILLVVIGGGMLVTALLALRRTRVAGVAALAMGVVLLVWGLVETVTTGYQGTAQITLLAVWVVGPALPLVKIGWDSRKATLTSEAGAR